MPMGGATSISTVALPKIASCNHIQRDSRLGYAISHPRIAVAIRRVLGAVVVLERDSDSFVLRVVVLLGFGAWLGDDRRPLVAVVAVAMLHEQGIQLLVGIRLTGFTPDATTILLGLLHVFEKHLMSGGRLGSVLEEPFQFVRIALCPGFERMAAGAAEVKQAPLQVFLGDPIVPHSFQQGSERYEEFTIHFLSLISTFQPLNSQNPRTVSSLTLVKKQSAQWFSSPSKMSPPSTTIHI